MSKKTILIAFVLFLLIMTSLLVYRPVIRPLVNKITGYTAGALGFTINWPPTLIMRIPNLTWDEDTIWPNAFDLDNYFTDRNNDALAFNVTGNHSINIVIDPVTHTVSFSQPQDWFGSELVFFTADDGHRGVTKSNIVNLTVKDVIDIPPFRGGGVGGPSAVRDFLIMPASIKVSLVQGETRRVILKINNTGFKSISVNLTKDIDLIKFKGEELNSKRIYLRQAEEKIQEIDIITTLETKPDVYFGKIIASTEDVRKEVPVFIEVRQKIPSFEIDVNIPQKFKEVGAGETIIAGIKIYNLEEVGLVNATISYNLNYISGEEILSEQEKIAIKKEISFNKKMKIPRTAEAGACVFYVRVDYEGKMGTGSDSFRIIEIEKPLISTWLIILIIILIILLLLIIIIIRWRIILGIKKRYEKGSEISPRAR